MEWAFDKKLIVSFLRIEMFDKFCIIENCEDYVYYKKLMSCFAFHFQ